MLQYRGFLGAAEFDEDSGLFHGDVINSRDVITFQSLNRAGLEAAFRDSVDDYLNSAS